MGGFAAYARNMNNYKANIHSYHQTVDYIKSLFEVKSSCHQVCVHHLGSPQWLSMVLRHRLLSSAIFFPSATIFRSLSTAACHVVFGLPLLLSLSRFMPTTILLWSSSDLPKLLHLSFCHFRLLLVCRAYSCSVSRQRHVKTVTT